MRKLVTVCGLVVALTLGLVAIAERQPARAATGDNLVLVWNEETLEAIRTLSPGPTVAVRALAVVHTAIYDASAAYDPLAVGTRLGANLRRPTVERTQANKERAVSFAAYLALVDLFPARQAVFAQQMATLGYAVDGTDTSTPATVGTTAAQAVVNYRHNDGANQLNGYADTSGYSPVNTWDKIVDPDRWQPLCVPLPAPGATECPVQQRYLTPHWRTVASFALKSADQYRPDRGPAVSVEKGKPSSAYLKEVRLATTTRPAAARGAIMQQAPQSREELLEHLLGDHKLVPDKDLTDADAATLATRHVLAHEDAYEAHEPHS